MGVYTPRGLHVHLAPEIIFSHVAPLMEPLGFRAGEIVLRRVEGLVQLPSLAGWVAGLGMAFGYSPRFIEVATAACAARVLVHLALYHFGALLGPVGLHALASAYSRVSGFGLIASFALASLLWSFGWLAAAGLPAGMLVGMAVNLLHDMALTRLFYRTAGTLWSLDIRASSDVLANLRWKHDIRPDVAELPNAKSWCAPFAHYLVCAPKAGVKTYRWIDTAHFMLDIRPAAIDAAANLNLPLPEIDWLSASQFSSRRAERILRDDTDETGERATE